MNRNTDENEQAGSESEGEIYISEGSDDVCYANQGDAFEVESDDSEENDTIELGQEKSLELSELEKQIDAA